MKALGKVAVLLGGRSSERDISLQSGQAVLDALTAAGVDAVPFDPADRPLCELKAMGVDRVFIALHGKYGEDGTVQGALDLLDIPYTGSGCMASALAMDKYRTKLIWQALGLPTPKALRLDLTCDPDDVVAQLGLPLIVKPNGGGSTLGLTKVTDRDQIIEAYHQASHFDDTVLAEAFVTGGEFTASVLDGRALPLVKIEAPEGNYDYHNKYFSDETRYLCPSGLPEADEKRCQAIALAAFEALGCRGWGRVDFLLDGEGQPQLLEANTSPGMTGHSLVPMAAKAVGIDFTRLVIGLLEKADGG